MKYYESCLLNQKNFDLVKKIEREVYPPHMRSYQDFDDLDEIMDYSNCDGNLDCIIKDDWYAIFCNGHEVEIIDLASRITLTMADINLIINKLKSFGDKVINMNARESTSYRLIKAFARRGLFDILQDDINYAFGAGEPFHEIKMKIKKINSFKEWYHIQEAIDAETEKALVPFMSKFTPEQKEEAEKELQTLRNSPDLIKKGQVFNSLQKFIKKKDKPKTEGDSLRKNWEDKGSTNDELKTYDFYKNENVSNQLLQEMMDLLRKFIDKKLITIQFENNKPVLMRNTLQGEEKLDSPDFTRFMSNLHQVRDSLVKYSGKSNYFNPIEEEMNHKPNLAAKGDNVWVFKGHMPDMCRLYGKNQTWCISSSTSAAHWFGYRIRHHQTQYFVFDFNKDENDPARYVNPGVAPPGRYSEWVDAKNQHEPDPEDPNSEIGINGYRSINEYKQYLVNKGIPLDTWKTTKPEEWEERLAEYYNKSNFSGAKNDPDPRVFPLYLKIASNMKDQDFDTLSDDEKTEFVMSKLGQLTEKQFDFAKTVGGYYNSLQLDDKIKFAVRTSDWKKIENILKNPDISDENVVNLLYYPPDKQKIAKLIIQKKPELSDNNVKNLIHYASDKQQIAELIIKKKPELSDDSVFNLFRWSSDNDKQEIAKLIIQYKPELSDKNIENSLNYASDKQEIAELIIKKKPKLSDDNVKNLIFYADDRQEIAKLIIEKKPELSDDNVKDLIYYAYNKQEIAKLIIENKPELSDDNVKYLLYLSDDKQEIAKLIIKKKPELSADNVVNLLYYPPDKQKIAELLQKDLDNISKLSDGHVKSLLHVKSDKQEMAQIINQYHTNKTPVIERLIKPYLNNS